MQEVGLNNFRTIVSEVSSFVGNPVRTLYTYLDKSQQFKIKIRGNCRKYVLKTYESLFGQKIINFFWV